MSLKKGPNIECDFRENTVPLTVNQEEVILEVKVCVKDNNKIVKLDWSVDERLMASDFQSSGSLDVNPNVTVEYRLFKNDLQIGSTITSENAIRTSDSGFISGYESAFTQNTQPNFTFCDSPSPGLICYQVKATLLPPDTDQGTNPMNSATVSDRSLVALCVDKS